MGTMLMSGIPLLLGSPSQPVPVSLHDAWLMLGVALTSFVAQLLSSRSLQLVAAARAAALGFTQVGIMQMMVTHVSTPLVKR
jgi:drug/metabolite transporter (DMT)-like permease